MRHTIQRRRSERGMTLVEILAVVIILGLLAGTLAVGFSGSFGKAKHELAKTAMGQIIQKLETYRIEKGTWPPVELGLKALSDGAATPNDSFYSGEGQAPRSLEAGLYLVIPGPGDHPYEIVSYGADGQPGGTGENADLSSIDLGAEKK